MRRERTKKNCVSTPSIFIVILSNLCFFHFSDSDSDFFFFWSKILIFVYFFFQYRRQLFLGYYNFIFFVVQSLHTAC